MLVAAAWGFQAGMPLLGAVVGWSLVAAAEPPAAARGEPRFARLPQSAPRDLAQPCQVEPVRSL